MLISKLIPAHIVRHILKIYEWKQFVLAIRFIDSFIISLILQRLSRDRKFAYL